jgi:ribose transport system substrate-binding protein
MSLASHPRHGVAAIALLACLALSACGSDDTESSTSTSSSSTTTATPAAGGDLAAVKQTVADITAQPSDFPDLPPLETLPEGKKFVYIPCGAPECVAIGSYMEPEAEKMGAEFKMITPGSTAQGVAQAFDSALAEKPDVLMTDAVEPSTWAPQLKKAQEQGIKTIAFNVSNPEETGVDWWYGSELFGPIGEYLADWVIADSEGKGKAVFVWPPQLAVFTPTADGFKNEMETKCPDCTADTLEVPAADIATPRLPNAVVSYLQKNPDVKYVVPAFGSMTLGLASAFKTGGIDAKILTQACSPPNYEAVKAGQEAVCFAKSLHMEGLLALDGAARIATGQETVENPRPSFQFLEADQIDFDPKEGWFPYPDYVERFRTIWGVN